MYSVKKKLEVIHYISENDCSLFTAQKKFNINRETIRIWAAKYKLFGIKGLKPAKKYRKYTGQFKVDAVEYMNKHHYSLKRICITLNISDPSILKYWASIYKCQGKDALLKGNYMKKVHRDRNKDKSKEELLEEIECLRMENAYLKKLRALVQEKTKSSNGKK